MRIWLVVAILTLSPDCDKINLMRGHILYLSFLLISGASQAADLIWDANATGGGVTDGGGTWLNADQWWDGGANQAWNSATPDNATVGNGGNGGTITLGGVDAGTIIFTNFSGTYTLTGGKLTNSTTIRVETNAGNVTINMPMSGSGTFIKNDAGITIFSCGNSTSQTYTGNTVVNGGILQVGTGWRNSTRNLPGGFGGSASGSNVELNGGNLKIWWPFTRNLGPDPEDIQLTGGAAGFSFMQYDRSGQIRFNNSTSFEVVWGSTYFNPSSFVLNESAADPQQVVRIDNPIDLNGADRTVACNSTRSISAASGNGYMSTAGGRLLGIVRNSGGTAAGLIKTGIGELQLTAANTYDGDTHVQQGTLSIYGGNNRVPTGSTLILGNGTESVTFKLRGYDQELTNGLETSGAGTDNRVVNGNSTLSVLSVDVASGNDTYAGFLGGSGSNENNFEFWKKGSGNLYLTQSNTYSGKTVIEGGELQVDERFFDDDAEIIMALATTNYLNFSGTDVVHSLVIGSFVAGAGTWGGPGSGADNITNQLRGAGMIYVDGELPFYLWDGPNSGGTGNAVSDGGSGTWSTSTDNWDIGLGNRVVWQNDTSAKAVFRTDDGTVTLGEDITLGEMDLKGTWGNQPYIIGNASEDNVLNFGGNNLVTSHGIYLTFNCGISGSPTIDYTSRAGDNSSALRLEPNGSLTMTLDSIDVSKNSANNRNALLFLGGDSTGNTATDVTWSSGAHQLTIRKIDSSTWTVGAFDIHGDCRVRVEAGTLVANGIWDPTHEIDVEGGTLRGTGALSVTRSGSTEHVRVLTGTLAPGDMTGTMTVNDKCEIDDTLQIRIDGSQGNTHGVLDVNGELDISAATIDFDEVQWPVETHLVFASYTTLTGEFAVTNALDSGEAPEIIYNYLGGNQIAVVVPQKIGTVFQFQ